MPPFTQQTSMWFSGGVTGIPGSGIPGTGTCIGSNLVCIASTVLYIINTVLVPVLFAVAFVVLLYGIARTYIFSEGEPEKVAQGHKLILWGVIAFAVMVSIWGIVNVVANTFGLTGSFAPPTPTSISPAGGVIPGGIISPGLPAPGPGTPPVFPVPGPF